MREAFTLSSLAVTLGLTLWRPYLGRRLQIGPGLAAASGVAFMFAAGSLALDDVGTAGETLWRPLLTITAIMLTTAAALRLGVMDRLASETLPLAPGSPARLFLAVFVLSAATSAVLNNDSAVLLLTPLVVLLVRRVYPRRPDLVVPFAFAVFMAAGVAPLVTSNPMNTIVAHYADLDFNEYAVRMLPIALMGWVVTFCVLRWIFRRELGVAVDDAPPPGRDRTPWTAGQREGLALVLLVLGAYPFVSYVGGSVWVVASSGAALAVLLCLRHGAGSPREVVVSGVSWEILIFLFGVFLLALGLRNAGIVDWLSSLYEGAGVGVIGVASALGSALINNHSMALTNLLAIDATPDTGQHHYLAALIGGDLGPRLLPIGSLAGLLWLAALRRLDVDVSLRQFAAVGITVTAPSLALSLLLLAAL